MWEHTVSVHHRHVSTKAADATTAAAVALLRSLRTHTYLEPRNTAALIAHSVPLRKQRALHIMLCYHFAAHIS